MKDSSESDDNKKEFLKHLDETCSISCGKEGSIGKFIQMIPVEQRALAGMVPSISNVVNSFSVLWKYALAGEDDKMIALQKEINEFRNKIYHSEISKGKAQKRLQDCDELFKHKIWKWQTIFQRLYLLRWTNRSNPNRGESRLQPNGV